jgi:CRP/FNR family transcriptional regulator, anaerobic regulatory protein
MTTLAPERRAPALHTIPPGRYSTAPGEHCAHFVIVHAGTVKVVLTAENGREIVLYRVRPGEICLQTFNCLVNGGNYSAAAEAETELSLELVPAGEFRRRIADDPPFREALFAAVAARFADMERLIEDVALTPIETRLARALLRLMDADGMVAATHEALATEIGSVREVVSRQLGLFARDGDVELLRGRVRVIAPGRLAHHAHLAA